MPSPPHEPVLRALLQGFEAVSEIEWIPLAEAFGRVLAHPVRSRLAKSMDDVLIEPGTVLDGPRLAWLCELGLEEVDVVRRPRVAILRGSAERSDPWTALLLAASRQVGASAVQASHREGAAAALPRAARSHEATLVQAKLAEAARDLGREIELPLADWGLEGGWARDVRTGVVFGLPDDSKAAWIFFEALIRPWLEHAGGRDATEGWEDALLLAGGCPTGFVLAERIGESVTPMQDLARARLSANALAWLPEGVGDGDAVQVRRLAGR